MFFSATNLKKKHFVVQGPAEQPQPLQIPEAKAGENLCTYSLERGHCQGYMRRWGFNAGRGECVQFIYGGCGGNANNFETQEACEQRCGGRSSCPLTVFSVITYHMAVNLAGCYTYSMIHSVTQTII